MKALVQHKHRGWIALACPFVNTPYRAQRIHGVVCNAGKPFDCRQLEDDAQVVKLVELIEVDIADFPATPKPHFKITLARQTEERIAYRRA